MDDLISRQAAIDDFDGIKVDEEYCTEYDIGFNDGIDLAVSKLSVLPSAQPNLQPTCNQLATDCISRQAAINAVYESSIGRQMIKGHKDLITILKALPPARPFNKGLWVKQELAPQTLLFCSLCGCKKPQGVAGNFCPNCGADMRGEEE